jgi:acyl carrier protein
MKAQNDFQKVQKEIKKLIAHIAEISEDKIHEKSNLADDLGIDSMKALEIIATIEKKYKITVPERKIPMIKTPKQIYDTVNRIIIK